MRKNNQTPLRQESQATPCQRCGSTHGRLTTVSVRGGQPTLLCPPCVSTVIRPMTAFQMER